MRRWSKGFTMVELMVVLAVLGVLAAIAIPNFISAANRAKEASLKANMHAFQFVAEDFLIKHEAGYATDAAQLAGSLMKDFENPFDLSRGVGAAWEDRASMSAGPSPTRGITSYADSAGSSYNVRGFGANHALDLILTSGLPSQKSGVAAEKKGGGKVNPADDGFKLGKPIKP